MNRDDFTDWSEGMFDAVAFAVEATDFERLCLWEKHHEQFGWHQVARGVHLEIGKVNDLPVCLCFTFERLQGHIVVFWNCTSRMADYDMAQEWVRKRFPAKWDHGRRPAHCNAMNFHHCVNGLGLLDLVPR